MGYSYFDIDTEQPVLTGILVSESPHQLLLLYDEIIRKTRLQNGCYRKEYKKQPRRPCQRLLKSPDLTLERKPKRSYAEGLVSPIR
jgi:hypothetical protein